MPYDVRMPDGTIIRNVPEGTKKADIERRYKADKARRQTDANPILGPILSFGKNAVDMLSFGLDDELGAVRDTLSPIKGRPDVWDGTSFGDAWRQNQQRREREKQATSKANPKSAIAGSIAGALAPAILTGGAGAAPTAARAGGMFGRGARAVAPSVAQGALYGAGSASGGVKERAKGAATGAALGLAGDVVGRGLGKAVARAVGGPKMAPAAARLAEQGVVMTPGQRAGPTSMMNRAESIMQSVPLLGDMVRGARTRGVRDLNEAVINDALSPIGGKITPGADISREVIRQADDMASEALDKTASRLAINFDDTLKADLDAIRRQGKASVGPLSGQLDATIDDVVTWRLQPGGAQGETVRSMLADLRAARGSLAGGRGNEGNLATQIGRIEDAVMNAIERGTPDKAALDAFKNARSASANMARLNKGAARATEDRLSNGALMSPSQILSAVKSPGYGNSARRVARGEAPMQRIAEDGAAILPDTVPNSGTFDRGLAVSLLGGAAAGGGGYAASDGDLGTAGALSLPFLLYTPQGQKILQQMAKRPELLNNIAGGIRRNSGLLGRAGVGAALGLNSLAP